MSRAAQNERAALERRHGNTEGVCRYRAALGKLQQHLGERPVSRAGFQRHHAGGGKRQSAERGGGGHHRERDPRMPRGNLQRRLQEPTWQEAPQQHGH
jgi:hypothetical protein